MIRRRVLLVCVVALLVVGSVPPAGATAGPSNSTDIDPSSSQTATATPPEDPEEDVLGWEDGYWHNESIDVDQSDGLNDVELDAVVARAMARVEHIRRLEFQKTVPVNVMSREEYASRQSSGAASAEFRAFDNAKFEALFLIGERNDSLTTQNKNRASSVLGFYSPARNEIMLIVSEEATLRIDELTLAHELVHALQDQHFRFGNGRTRDQANADNGLTEGDANYVDYLYGQACDGGEWDGTCVKPPSEEGSGGGGGLANIGVYFVKYQPYSDGPNFIQYLRNRGGWEAVNAAYRDFPESAEQVIHPEKYGEDAPTKVTLRDRNTSAWTRVRPDGRPDYGVLGESSLASMFVYPLYHSDGRARIVEPSAWLNRTADGSVSSFDPLNYGVSYAEGWDGDRLHVYRNADNETAYVWRLVWDTEADATEFVDGYRQVLEYWGAEKVGESTWVIGDGEFADAFHVVGKDKTVTIVNAPTVEELSAVRTSVTVQQTTASTTAPATPTTETDAGGGDQTTEGGEADPPMTFTEGTTEAETPGLGAVVAVVALGVAAALFARRRE